MSRRFIPRNPIPPRITFSHLLNNIIQSTRLNSSIRCNRRLHTRSLSSTSRCQCITDIPHTLICTRRSRLISLMLRCIAGTTIILPTRHHPPSCILLLSITRSACHRTLTILAPPPSCSAPFLRCFPPQSPTIRIPQPKFRLPPVIKFKSRTIPRPPFMSGRLVSHLPLSLRKTSSI